MRFLIGTVFYCLLSVLLHGQSEETTVDSLQRVLSRHPVPDKGRVDALNDLGYRYWIVDSNQSIVYGKEALQLSEELDYTLGLAMAKRVLGVAYWTVGRLKLALENLTAAQKTYENIGDEEGAANCLMNTGMVYADIADYDRALTIYEKSIEKFTKLDLKSRIATTFNKIGFALLEKDQLPDAKRYFTDALNMHADDDFFYGMAEAHNGLGKIFILEKELEQADYHLRKAVDLGQKVNDEDGLVGNTIQFGKLLRLRKNYSDSSIKLLDALEKANKKQLRKYALEAYGELITLKKETGDLDEALKYFDAYLALKDSVFNTEKSKQIAALEFSTAMADKEKEILLLREKERTDAIIKWSFAAGFGLLGIIGFLVYHSQNQRRAKRREMHKRNEELLVSKEELAKTALENAKLKQKEMAQQLEFKNKELTSYTLNFVQKNELLQQLQDNLALAKNASPTSQAKILAEMRRDIRQHVNIDRDWEDFKRYFEEVHTDFYGNLNKKHPDLSPNDIKICALTRLNLNTKETASILGISPESAKTARYRLRKKLNLTPEQELFDYFLQLEA